VLSLNKAFSAGGGALVFSDPSLAQKVLRAGGPMVFSGALQPALLGAAVASARVHLSNELPGLQAKLRTKLSLMKSWCQEFGVTMEDETESPVYFLHCGTQQRTFDLVRWMRTRGFCVTAAMYPIVPRHHAGIRFCVTLHNDDSDIKRLVEGFAEGLSELEAGSYTAKSRESYPVPESYPVREMGAAIGKA
jgi:7-keto-8-aminopelargonate synthetase-like enzyme